MVKSTFLGEGFVKQISFLFVIAMSGFASAGELDGLFDSKDAANHFDAISERVVERLDVVEKQQNELKSDMKVATAAITELKEHVTLLAGSVSEMQAKAAEKVALVAPAEEPAKKPEVAKPKATVTNTVATSSAPQNVVSYYAPRVVTMQQPQRRIMNQGFLRGGFVQQRNTCSGPNCPQ